MKTTETLPNYDISQLIYPDGNASCRTVSVEDAYYEFLQQLGGGNASKGLRRAVIACAKWQAHERGRAEKP